MHIKSHSVLTMIYFGKKKSYFNFCSFYNLFGYIITARLFGYSTIKNMSDPDQKDLLFKLAFAFTDQMQQSTMEVQEKNKWVLRLAKAMWNHASSNRRLS